MTWLLNCERLVDGTGHDGPAWLRIGDGVVVERGDGAHPQAGRTAAAVVPGALDLHVHGALGVDLGAAGIDPTPALRHHHRSGTTTLLASIATTDPGSLITRTAELRPFVAAGEIAGLHLEGPWLAAEHRGAHATHLLRNPSRAQVEAVLRAGDGSIRVVTLAPELPGAIDVIPELVAADVVVAIGHTAATADTVRAAIDAGATLVTHLFNGMPSLHHRRPGPVGVSLTDPRLVVELIADGVHLDDTTVDLVRRTASGRIAFVSDAMAATGLGDGEHRLAGSDVVVRGGVAQLADGSSLAGGTTPVLSAARRVLDRGADLAEIVELTSSTSARVLARPGHHLRPGESADLVDLGAQEFSVLRRGTWLR